MRTDIVSCKDYVEIKKKELEEEIQHFNRKPVLAVIQIDNDQASNSYIKGKQKDCDEIGIEMRHVNIHSNVAEQKEVEGIIKVIANSDADGIIIQLPIPDKYDLDRLQLLIPPEKDLEKAVVSNHVRQKELSIGWNTMTLNLKARIAVY